MEERRRSSSYDTKLGLEAIERWQFFGPILGIFYVERCIENHRKAKLRKICVLLAFILLLH